ncbi:MAG: molybdopterin dinucleotide binding domain-containing protein, partial [Thiohalorhabdaceae bacterium]
FAYTGPAAIFREHAALSGLASATGCAFDISGLADLSDDGYERLEPVQWPVTAAAPNGTERLFGDGGFLFPDGRARLVPVAAGRQVAADSECSLVLNTGRVRDQWHTMTRTGKVARLAEHRPEPFAAFHAEDADRLGLVDGGLVRLGNDQGQVLLRVRVDEGQGRGTVFVPFHWSAATAAAARVDALVAAVTDPVSGQPASKHARVWAEAVTPAWSGFLLRRTRWAPAGVDYWAEVARADCWEYPLAGLAPVADWTAWHRDHLGSDGDWLVFSDPGTGRYRAAQVVGGRLEAVLFVGPGAEAGESAWLAERFASETLGEAERGALLAGGHGSSERAGPAVCACFGVDAATLRAAIADGADSVAALGERLGAGTNCGSCIPEIRSLIAEAGNAAATKEATS